MKSSQFRALAALVVLLGVVATATVLHFLAPVYGGGVVRGPHRGHPGEGSRSARLGAGKIHPLLLFLGIFGGLEAFGGWGIILGPLAVALFVAAFELYAREVSARR